MAKTFSKDEVSSHNKSDSLWVVIDEDVYDLSKFQDEHPGESPPVDLSLLVFIDANNFFSIGGKKSMTAL